MWVTRGGPPLELSVLFEYDPSRAQGVADRLLQGFSGVLQADAYAGYASVSGNSKALPVSGAGIMPGTSLLRWCVRMPRSMPGRPGSWGGQRLKGVGLYSQAVSD